ncbi:hypothetical protein TNCT_454831 [Trichonephila clavata]|uniref:Uncharacterized protein n=1 Tax=Trichonephila clavata TaxID=2740835 RepID=A0A8X6KYX4_TRICU|nr:hypothetical protein TNCT_454831 [Trichonephila clavata]
MFDFSRMFRIECSGEVDQAVSEVNQNGRLFFPPIECFVDADYCVSTDVWKIPFLLEGGKEVDKTNFSACMHIQLLASLVLLTLTVGLADVF